MLPSHLFPGTPPVQRRFNELKSMGATARWERSLCWEKSCSLSPQTLKMTVFLPGSKSPLAEPRTEEMFSISKAPGVFCSCSSLFMCVSDSWQQREWREWVLHTLPKTNGIFKSWLVSCASKAREKPCFQTASSFK